MTMPRILRRRPRDEQGSALVITLMVMALVTALATTVAVLTIDNLQSSWRAQQAGSAVNAADAGVSQAMSYLRTSGVSGLSCSPGCGAVNPWGDQDSPATATLPGSAGQGYEVWIEVEKAFPEYDPGKYVIHSTGTAAGTAARSVVVDVSVTNTDVPRGVFARTINGGGSASVSHESIFSIGCVWDRSKIAMNPTDIDAAYGIPVGVHSSQYITTSNGSGQFCPSTDRGLIHMTGSGSDRTGQPCSTAYPNDQDALGGDLSGSDAVCKSLQSTYANYYGAHDLDSETGDDVVGSYLKDDSTLFKLFGIKIPGLSDAQVDQLRTIAQSQGTYTTSATTFTQPTADNAVLFFDLTKGTDLGKTVDLNDIEGYYREKDLQPTDSGCPKRSLVIVIDGGNAKLNSNHQMYASLFLTSSAPYGQVVKANGTADFIGTIYADTVNLVGNVNISLDQCFLANQSPGLLDLQVGSYRELDRGLS